MRTTSWARHVGINTTHRHTHTQVRRATPAAVHTTRIHGPCSRTQSLTSRDQTDFTIISVSILSGEVAEWLACLTQAQKARVQIAVATLSGNSLRQTVHTHCASVQKASAKLVAALLRVAGVTAGLAEK